MSSIISLLFMYIFIVIIYKASVSQSQNLENILRAKNFDNIQRLSMYDTNGKTFLKAYSNSMQYLFIKRVDNRPIGIMSHQEFQNAQSLAKTLKCDRIILYVNQAIIPIELSKMAVLYSVEIWNNTGESNFEQYRMIPPTTTSSRLAKTLKPENAIFEHKKNGVIAKDTCHIEPSVSPIQENPTSFFKKKGPQRL